MKYILFLSVFISVSIFGQINLNNKFERDSSHSIPQSIIEEDSAFMPMRIGNLYQFIESGYGGGVVWYYLRYGTVSRDTVINNQKYSLYTLHNDDHWFRYSGTEKKLYEWYDANEMLYMDFNKAPGDTFIHLNHFLPATVSGGDTNLFSTNFVYKGFILPGIGGTRSELFAEGLGLYYSGGEGTYPSSTFRNFTLIMAKLIDSLGNIIQFTDHYKPEISLTPITIIDSSNFKLNFIVNHEYNRSTPPGHTSLFFMESVKLESFYSKEDSIIELPVINANGVINYSVSTTLDTLLLKAGFTFNYRIIAKDKGIIPETSYSPDSGYYQCVWNGLTGIDDKTEYRQTFALSQNYPNPFNPSTVISYQLPAAGDVTLKVFDVLGREVATLVDEFRDAGYHEVEFNLESSINHPASGVYFYQLKSGSYIETKKMIYLK